jgi:hypothetical protein
MRRHRLQLALVDLSASAARPRKEDQRRIELFPWQQAPVDQAPGALLRGLIHTDGWRGVNRVTAKGKRYEYPRYQFSNRSDDIRQIFTDARDALEWRQWTRFHVSVARKESVAHLDEFVGPRHERTGRPPRERAAVQKNPGGYQATQKQPQPAHGHKRTTACATTGSTAKAA